MNCGECLMARCVIQPLNPDGSCPHKGCPNHKRKTKPATVKPPATSPDMERTGGVNISERDREF